METKRKKKSIITTNKSWFIIIIVCIIISYPWLTEFETLKNSSVALVIKSITQFWLPQEGFHYNRNRNHLHIIDIQAHILFKTLVLRGLKRAQCGNECSRSSVTCYRSNTKWGSILVFFNNFYFPYGEDIGERNCECLLIQMILCLGKYYEHTFSI